MKSREVYPKAPLRLVSVEFRFPLTSATLTRRLWDAFEDTLKEAALVDVESYVEDPEDQVPAESYKPVLRRISRDKKRAVTLYTDALTVELANYQHYAELQDLVKAALKAVSDSSDKIGYTRIGLRFINEILSSLVHESDDKWQDIDKWRPFVNQQLIHVVTEPPEGLCAFAGHGTIMFHGKSSKNDYVSLDFGIQPEGIVSHDDVLSLGGPSGPCFVLDIDAFSNIRTTEEEPDQLLKLLDQLHDAVENTFQWSITDQTREAFRGHTADSR